MATANVELTPVKGLMIKGTVGTDIRINERKSYLPSTISIGNQESMYAYIGQNRGESYLLNLMADYKLSLDKHNWGVMGAFEFEHQGQNGTTMINSGFPSDNFGWDNMGSGSRAHPDVTSYKKIGERASYIGRINYSYDNRYLLTANIRVDGSSNFAANKQWGVFTGNIYIHLQYHALLPVTHLLCSYAVVGKCGGVRRQQKSMPLRLYKYRLQSARSSLQ